MSAITGCIINPICLIAHAISYALCGTTQPISEGLGELIKRLIGK